jgi:Questin oxidase-like
MTSLGYADAINDALERLGGLGYEWGDRNFVNHGPMGAEALAVLGYPEQVSQWADAYRARPHHDPPPPRFALDAADESSWRPALGAFERAGDWEQLFVGELAESHWREVLARWWPRLLPGLFAGLTHGAIRTAHAVRHLSVVTQPTPPQLGELARALAYWARFTALPGQPRLGGSLSVPDAVAALPRPPAEAGAGLDAADHRLGRLVQFPGYAESLHTLAPEHAQWLLSEMTAHFAGVYLAHPEVMPVPLIHAVTAPAAVRLVLPHLPTEQHEPSVAALWQVHTALLLAFTSHRGDEHVLKFTEACQREHALRPDPRYPTAVLAAQQRIRNTQETTPHL